VARGTQHRKRRPAANAVARPVTSAPAKRKPAQWEEELFFQRLRNHAKWVFLFLAIVFALSFVVFGVGSGSSGISDILQNSLHFGSGSGTSVGSLKKKAREHPKDAQAFRDLATRLEQDQRLDEAITALVTYSALRPKDTSAIEELAGLYHRRAGDLSYAAQVRAAQGQALATPATSFQPSSKTALGLAYQDPKALQDPIAAAISSGVNDASTTLYTRIGVLQRKEVAADKRLAALEPQSAQRQLALGTAAESSGDSATAITAYTAFLKLAPTDPNASDIRKRLASLKQAAASGTTSTTVTGG
jgi:tetratricopeptide (TPR) repeat protein